MRELLPYIGITSIALLLASIDTAFLPALHIHSANITLAVSLFIVAVFSLRLSLTVHVLTYLLLALTTSSQLIIQLTIGIAVLFFINWLFESFFTNRTVYTVLVSGIIGHTAYYLLLTSIIAIYKLISPSLIFAPLNSQWFKGILLGLLICAMLQLLAYFITGYLSKQLRSYFVITSRSL